MISVVEFVLPFFSQASNAINPESGQFLMQTVSSGLYSFFVLSNYRKTKMLETRVKYHLELIEMRLNTRVNQEYLSSEEFLSNILQSIRAAQSAESEKKIEYIARALAGCTLDIEDISINKAICMRIIDQITVGEMEFITDIILDGRFKRRMGDLFRNIPFAETEENTVTVRGLIQLGLLVDYSGLDQSIHLQPSALAEQVILLSRQTIL